MSSDLKKTESIFSKSSAISNNDTFDYLEFVLEIHKDELDRGGEVKIDFATENTEIREALLAWCKEKGYGARIEDRTGIVFSLILRKQFLTHHDGELIDKTIRQVWLAWEAYRKQYYLSPFLPILVEEKPDDPNVFLEELALRIKSINCRLWAVFDNETRKVTVVLQRKP